MAAASARPIPAGTRNPRGGGKASLPHPYSDWATPPRYELRKTIGRGSYGIVTEAYDLHLKRVVAIKRIENVFEDTVDCKRILREIAILNRLSHEHVVKVLDICVPEDPQKFDELYLILEIGDADLKKLSRTQIYLSESHVKIILYNLLIGVKYIHSAGILHRDLKPANVLVNQDCSIRICDFGLARTVDLKEAKLPTSPHDDDKVIGVPHTKNMKKQLTGHVVTRWYRAPELILLQENYSEAIDVWSVACIFAELLGMMKENVKSLNDRGPIFPGSCCFPLSPDQKHNADYKFHTKGNRDQLSMIFNVLGTPSDEDIAEIEKEDARKYIKIFPKREPPQTLRQMYRGASDEAVDLLQRMLAFNPRKRITVDECLQHPLFVDIRNPSLETTAASPVRLPFDDWCSLNEKQLRYAFLKEIQRYHEEVEIPAELQDSAPPRSS